MIVTLIALLAAAPVASPPRPARARMRLVDATTASADRWDPARSRRQFERIEVLRGGRRSILRITDHE